MKTSNQLCCLRELVMAKQAYDRSVSEFLRSCNVSQQPAKLASVLEALAHNDARDLTVDELIDVKELLGFHK